MLVRYDGTRTKLAAEDLAQKDTTNSVQQSIQPVNQQAAPTLEPKNNKPAAEAQTSMGTPRIYNPTLQRMGIQMPEPRDPRQVSTKLSQLRGSITRAQQEAALQEAIDKNAPIQDINDADLIQTLKRRDYYDSPYMDSRDYTRMALMAPQRTSKSSFNEEVAGGVGALAGAALPLAVRGATPTSLLASAALGGLGYFAGKNVSGRMRQKKMRAYRYYLEGNPRS